MEELSAGAPAEKVRGRRALQIVTAILAVIPVVTGLIGLSGLHDPLYSRSGVIQDVLLDSNLRFFSGAWLGLGLALFGLFHGSKNKRFYSELSGVQFSWAGSDDVCPCSFSRYPLLHSLRLQYWR